MASSFRNRTRRPARRDAFRDPNPVILVVCEGAVTEKQYVKGYQRACRKARVDVEVSNEHGTPKKLVGIAKRLKLEAEARAEKEEDDNLKYDDIWCVFDIDDHPHVAEAKQMANENDIKLAISNPCFELWLLLHFRDCPGTEHRHRIQEMLKERVPDYDKSIDFEAFRPGCKEATRRAAYLNQLADSINEPWRNPTTSVYKLLKAIAVETP